MSETETLSPILDEDIQKAVLQLLQKACERELVLATAESCTGGMLASLLTDVNGCAHAFDRGFVTYTDESKVEMLGIPLDLIKREGAVSRTVAVSMAENALERSKANIALSITGFADNGEEPGLVHFACARAAKTTSHREEHFGPIGRGATRVECMRVAIEMLTEML